MPQPNNSSSWITQATKIGVNLDFLKRDEKYPFRGLEELGLPHPIAYFITPVEIDSPITKEILSKTACFCRLLPKKGGCVHIN